MEFLYNDSGDNTQFVSFPLIMAELKHTNKKDEFEEMGGDDHTGHQLSW